MHDVKTSFLDYMEDLIKYLFLISTFCQSDEVQIAPNDITLSH